MRRQPSSAHVYAVKTHSIVAFPKEIIQHKLKPQNQEYTMEDPSPFSLLQAKATLLARGIPGPPPGDTEPLLVEIRKALADPQAYARNELGIGWVDNEFAQALREDTRRTRRWDGFRDHIKETDPEILARAMNTNTPTVALLLQVLSDRLRDT